MEEGAAHAPSSAAQNKEPKPQGPPIPRTGTSRSGRPSHARNRRSLVSSCRHRLFRTDLSHGSLIAHLLLVSFATGLLDAGSYAEFGIFASNQTGNSIILFLEAVSAGVPDHATFAAAAPLLPVGISLASFLFFGALYGQLGRAYGVTRRIWLLFSTATQATFLLVPALLVTTGAIVLGNGSSSHVRAVRDTVLIFFYAASAGIQVSMAKTVGVPEIPSAVLTSAYSDLITDPHLLVWSIRDPAVQSRNIRLSYIFSLWSGTVVGAAVQVLHGTEATTWSAFALRVVGVIIVLLAPAAERTKMKDSTEGTTPPEQRESLRPAQTGRNISQTSPTPA